MKIEFPFAGDERAMTLIPGRQPARAVCRVDYRQDSVLSGTRNSAAFPDWDQVEVELIGKECVEDRTGADVIVDQCEVLKMVAHINLLHVFAPEAAARIKWGATFLLHLILRPITERRLNQHALTFWHLVNLAHFRVLWPRLLMH